jgi:hypothetical protein
VIRLSLSIGGATCKAEGCRLPSRLFGVCREHEPIHIGEYFDEAVRSGMCDTSRPACFKDDTEWREYVAAWVVANYNTFGARARVDYCRDCNLKFKAEMMQANRCDHHEVVFIRSDKFQGDVIGVSVDKDFKHTQAWETAVFGVAGDVIAMPPPDVLERSLNRIAEKTAKKKRGPKFKKDRKPE